jgi:hypothetical protein
MKSGIRPSTKTELLHAGASMDILREVFADKKKTPWLWSASELCRPSDRDSSINSGLEPQRAPDLDGCDI